MVVLAYNEEARIRYVLEHAVRWADEILVINKSSTDGTKTICQQYGSRVRIVDVPFSAQGHEDIIAISKLATYDWIYFGTASEIPTRRIIERIHQTLDETQGELDLVYVPRKYYSFGIHDTRSPWSVNYFPFLINRRKAIITNTIHHNFHPSDPNNTARINFTDDCCVYHLTHTTATSYMRAMTDYFAAEAEACQDPQVRIQECIANIIRPRKRLLEGNDELLGHYFAWSIYWLGTALFVWEKWRGVDVDSCYRQLKQHVLETEWLQHDTGDVNNKEGVASSRRSAQGKMDKVGHVLPQVSVGSPASTSRLLVPGGLAALERKVVLDLQLKAGVAILKAVLGRAVMSHLRKWRQRIQKSKMSGLES
jgi:hypothetical protein